MNSRQPCTRGPITTTRPTRRRSTSYRVTEKLKTESGLVELTAGDYVTLPANESGGNRVLNDSERPLRYLAISTMNEPDVTVYPEMDKFGVFIGSPPGGRGERTLEGYYHIDDKTDYWDA